MTLPSCIDERAIEMLSKTGSVSKTSKLLGVSRMTLYRWKQNDPEFAVEWELALQSNRLRMAERVRETAYEMALAKSVPVLAPKTGKPVLDDNFMPVTKLDISQVNTKILMKLMDKAMGESEPNLPNLNINVNVPQAIPEQKLISPGDEAFVIDDEFKEYINER